MSKYEAKYKVAGGILTNNILTGVMVVPDVNKKEDKYCTVLTKTIDEFTSLVMENAVSDVIFESFGNTFRIQPSKQKQKLYRKHSVPIPVTLKDYVYEKPCFNAEDCIDYISAYRHMKLAFSVAFARMTKGLVAGNNLLIGMPVYCPMQFGDTDLINIQHNFEVSDSESRCTATVKRMYRNMIFVLLTIDLNKPKLPDCFAWIKHEWGYNLTTLERSQMLPYIKTGYSIGIQDLQHLSNWLQRQKHLHKVY